MKKINRLFLTIIGLFIIFLFVYLTPKNYTLEYEVSDVLIKETYNKENEYYLIEYIYRDNKYKEIIYSDYTKSRKLIDKVDIISLDDAICLVGKSNEIDIIPLCKNDLGNISYHLIDNLENKISRSYFKKVDKINDKYNNITLNYLNDRTFLIWNYNGIDVISKETKKTIEFFDKDVYEIKLANKVNNYFVIPDYEEDYYFDTIYLYNVDKDKKSVWNLNKSISFDSYLIGNFDKSLYLFDKKQKVEYELVPHKEKLRKINPTILNNGKFEKTSIQKLINSELNFTYDNILKYEVKDGKLYKIIDNYEELISYNEIKNIVYQDKSEVYYLVDDSLYLYSDILGEVKLMSDFEWTFNYENIIFIY